MSILSTILIGLIGFIAGAVVALALIVAHERGKLPPAPPPPSNLEGTYHA